MSLADMTEDSIRREVKSLGHWNCSHKNPVRLAELRGELSRRLEIKVDPEMEHVLTDYTWNITHGSLYAHVPDHGQTCGARLLHSLLYKRPLSSYGPDSFVRLRDRDCRNLTKANIPIDTGRGPHQRAPKSNDGEISAHGQRGFSLRGGGYAAVRFHVNNHQFYFGKYRAEFVGVGKAIANDLYNRVFSRPAIDFLSPAEIEKVCLPIVNQIRSDYGMKPLRRRRSSS